MWICFATEEFYEAHCFLFLLSFPSFQLDASADRTIASYLSERDDKAACKDIKDLKSRRYMPFLVQKILEKACENPAYREPMAAFLKGLFAGGMYVFNLKGRVIGEI